MHGLDDPTRAVPHGVFTEDPIIATEKAWEIAKSKGVKPHVESPGNRNWVYDIPYAGAGILGERPGAAAGNPVLNLIMIVVKPDSNRIVTAFPM
ncbi:hypothetical protein ACFPTX_17030 [Pseudomonas sp. GCM10022188]|uniref:hypothetical protein n=1 Tax=Pseudomonas TaxID=286 RepID=UPI001E4C87B7|nr:hypothetical protein [Pseudomonas oryzagri]MCC6074180.1 hypothetical protein [Pseudomonas oryzagri]